MTKTKYYDIRKDIKEHPECLYYMVFGKRSGGKTTSSELYGLERGQVAYIRRYEEDFKSKYMGHHFDTINDEVKMGKDSINNMTNGEFNCIKTKGNNNREWYFAKFNEELNDYVYDNEPRMIGIALSQEEHFKGGQYPNIRTIIFDEFIARGGEYAYLDDEFIKLCNIISTIIRAENNNDVKIIMLGNTISKFCPYFTEMGLKHVQKLEASQSAIYEYGLSSELKVFVKHTEIVETNKKNSTDKYFAFDNPKLRMITGDNGKGAWELDIYPHLPCKYLPKDIIGNFFIILEENILQADIVCIKNKFFTFIHRKTTPIKNTDRDIIFTLEYNPNSNYYRCLNKPNNKITEKISKLFYNEKVFYQDNEIGDIVTNYFQQSLKTLV